MSSNQIAELGSKIIVQEKGADDEEVFFLTPYTDITKGWVGLDTPMGQALVGTSPGETVKVKGPRGDIRFDVLKVETT